MAASAGIGVPLDRGGQDRAAALPVEERRHQRLEVDALGGRHRDQFRGAGRGGVHVQPGQRGDGRAPGSRVGEPGPARSSIADSARLAADRRQGLDRRLARPAPRPSPIGRSPGARSAAASSFQRPGEPDRRLLPAADPVRLGAPASRPTSLSRSFSGFRSRVSAASARASSALTRIDGGKPPSRACDRCSPGRRRSRACRSSR